MFVVTVDVELFEISWQNICVDDSHALNGVSSPIDGLLIFEELIVLMKLIIDFIRDFCIKTNPVLAKFVIIFTMRIIA